MKTEKQTRYWMMEHAKKIGAAEDLQNLFEKWDKAIFLAPEKEKEEMARSAILEIQRLLDIHGSLTINDKIIKVN